MHPTLSEQLAGVRRILAEVIAPQVADPYPTDILHGVLAALEALEYNWHEVPRYLRWDADCTLALLLDARGALDDTLAADISAASTSEPTDPLDLAGLEAYHGQLRSLLARAVPAIVADVDHSGPHSDVHKRMIELFRERAQRFPFALTGRPNPRPNLR